VRTRTHKSGERIEEAAGPNAGPINRNGTEGEGVREMAASGGEGEGEDIAKRRKGSKTAATPFISCRIPCRVHPENPCYQASVCSTKWESQRVLKQLPLKRPMRFEMGDRREAPSP
jgi:hypothetical protein